MEMWLAQLATSIWSTPSRFWIFYFSANLALIFLVERNLSPASRSWLSDEQVIPDDFIELSKDLVQVVDGLDLQNGIIPSIGSLEHHYPV